MASRKQDREGWGGGGAGNDGKPKGRRHLNLRIPDRSVVLIQRIRSFQSCFLSLTFPTTTTTKKDSSGDLGYTTKPAPDPQTTPRFFSRDRNRRRLSKDISIHQTLSLVVFVFFVFLKVRSSPHQKASLFLFYPFFLNPPPQKSHQRGAMLCKSRLLHFQSPDKSCLRRKYCCS